MLPLPPSSNMLSTTLLSTWMPIGVCATRDAKRDHTADTRSCTTQDDRCMNRTPPFCSQAHEYTKHMAAEQLITIVAHF